MLCEKNLAMLMVGAIAESRQRFISEVKDE